MPITPGKDKDAFWRRIRGDPEVQRLLGIEGAANDLAAQHIVKQREIQQPLGTTSRYLCIFETPSGQAKGPFIKTVMQVDALVPAERQHIADSLLERAVALLEGWAVNGRAVELEGQIGNIACANGFYRCGARFFYYSSKGLTAQP